MNEFSFSENSLAGVPAEGLREEAFSPRLQLEDAGRVTGLEPYGEISHQSFKTMDMVEPPPPVGSGLDFKEALAVYDTLEDGPARVALSNELDKWERRQALENYDSPLGERERREYQQKVERLDALGMDWKAHPEARKKAAEAYGEEWVRAFEAVPDEHKSRVRGEKVLEEFYSRPGDRNGDSMIRYLSSVDAPEGIRGSRDVWDRWNAGRQPFFKAQEKEAEAGRSFAAKAVPVIRAMMNGEGFLEALGKAGELTPEEENFAMLHCGYGTPWGQAVQHAADWLRGRGFDLHPEAAVERRAKELADAYVKERERYVSKNDASLSWGGLPNPFSRTMDDFRQEARDEMTGNITDANVFDFAKALLDLKTEDPMAAEAVIGLYKADAERLRNDSTLFVSPFNRTMRMMMESSSSLFEQLLLGDVREGDTVEWQPTGESFAPVVRDSEGKQAYRVLTPDQNEMISQIRAMKAEIAESPDGAWWIRRQFDGLGRMAAQTSFFLATRGMGTFASVANDRMEELRAQGVSPLESLIRGGIAGGTEVLVERLGGESLFKTLRFLGRKMPFAGKFAGYMGSAADMMKRGLYGNAALRYGVASLAAGGSEWMEEFIQPTLQAPLDAGLARLFGSRNGMTVEDWKELLRGAADPDLGFQMLMFGAVVGGAQIPAFAREARVSRVGAPQIEGLGIDRAEAERIASIVDPVEKSREIFQAALSMSDRAAQLESVRQGFSAMKEDFSWLARQEAYQAEVELLNLPRVEDLGDGSWRFTTTVRDAEGQESYDVLELSEQDATARMQALLHDGIRLRMLETQQAFAVDRTIDQLSQSGKYVFEDMGRAETVETARKLAEAARLRIAEGADVNAEAQDLGTRMTYGQVAGMGSSFEERVKLGVARGEVSASRRVHSNAYRVAMRNGQTLIRFHKGEVTVPELLEEVLETHLTEDMENTKHSLDWYANNLRALQDALRKEGYLSKGKDLIRKDGEVSVKDVVEGMSMLAKGDVLARAADMRLPQWMKDFLQMVRQWVSSAKALLDLGTGLHEMERRRLAGESVPIDADFAQMVHALSNSLESYWMQEGARQGEADVQRIVEEVGGSGVSMSLAEDSSVSFSLVSIPSGEVITTAAEMRARLKPLQGKVFVNKNTGIQAVIEARVSGKTVGKAGAAQMSVANLKALGFSAEEARRVHYTAAARIHELFENAEDGFFEEAYKQDSSKAGAYHFFNTVDIGGIGAFDVNVTAIKYVKEQEGNVLYTLELTIENPAARGAASREGRLPTPFKDGVSTRNLSSYRSFVEKEKAAVRKKAVADGTFMKAPNGANTNLTEDQWLAVRTAAFKNWFGDWEHDPQNASKVVDENGEPRVVYHGSHQWFTSFNDGKQRQQSGAPAGTIFANDNREIAVSFADYYGGHADEVILDPNDERHPRYSWGIYREGGIYDLFMNVRNPLVVDFEGRPWLDSSKGGDINALCSKAKESGHDGVIALNIVDVGLNDQENVPASTDYVAFDSVQVKSAAQNRGTYDPKNPDITFSIVSAQEQGLFRDGHFEAGNAVITEPGVTFSIAALHASPHSFRKFDTAFMGKGEGAQAYGWGLYFAENPKVNRSYMNQFAQDKATWKFREVETGVIEVMQRSLVGSFLPKDALPEAKEDASDIAWSVLGDLVDAARGSMTVLDIVMELHDEIDTNRKYAETYPQEREKLEQLEGFMLSLLDHLDEIEVRTGMPSNYRVELNVEDSELMGWDYVDETVLALLKDSPVEEVRYALERAERRADYRGENVSGKDVYQELFDAFWDGEDGTKQEAQKAASVSLLSSDIKGIKYADGYTRNKAEEEQTYNYVIFDGNDIKITAFADESTGGAWADYEDPTATFSIIGEKAESFQEYHNNGLSYTDPADGKRKAIIDSRGVRLRKEHVSVSEGGHVNVSLAAALDFPELFRAYPELRKLRVDFYRDSRSGTGGFTDPQEHYIAVNVARGGKNAAPGMVLDTILHEVQHVIQGYEGFAVGAGNMSREQALAYLGESMSQLAGRDDAWAKEALPRLERMRQELETGTLQPAFVYVFSHGEQEARLAGSFEKNSEGVVMSGLNGFRLLDAPPFSIPLTGDITELGGITFGAGRFGRMAGRVLAPNGDWLYDEMVFRMRAAAQRSVSKLRLFETGDRERGLELLAEAQELISTVERFLPHTYGFGLEPYKIWLNVFSLLYGNSGKMAPGDAVASALEAIPMKRWPEIMEGSIGKSFVNWAEKRPELEDVVEEARREIAERQADYELDSAPDADNRAALAARKGVEQEVWRRLFEEHGAEFLEEYGEQKVFRLVGKFMARVVEQIDRFRKDRTLGRIRRVAASVAPRTNPQGKPLRGKMDAESYRRLEDRLRLMEMTPAQYDAFFRKNFPEVLDEEAAGQQEGRTLWEDVKPQDMVTVETTDAEGGALALTVTKATFEAYACYEKMSVETAENAARALGEFIATRREAWENAAESKKNEIEDLLRPVLEAAGRTDDQAMATHRKQARLKTLPSGPMSLTGYLLNFSQYMQGLQSVPAFRGIAKKFERRAARFAVQKQACEKDTLAFVKKAAGRILQTEDEYEIADWIYEQRGGLDTGLTITEQEPDWQGKAREEYRAGVLNLIRRKVRKRGAARTLAHVAFLMKDMDAELKAEIERIWPDARDEVWSEKDAAVFTEKELDRYGSQEKYVEEHAARARKASKWGKGKSPYQAQSYKLDHISRMEAAYIILLSQQEDYQEMLRLKGFTQEILEGLEQFAGSEVMEFSRALREKLNERGQEVKEVTESRYGAPFPLIENYFRAFFDVGIEAIDQSIMDAASYGDAATGGKFGLIHARKKHHASLDLSIDVLTAYYAAMNEQDVYLYGSEISRDMRALINYRGENGTRGARVLEKVIGRDALNKLLVWCDSFDKGMAGNVRGFLEMQKSLNRISSAAAITLLPGRVGTWLKQSTALINAAFSSDEIDPHEWAASMARMAAGKLALSPRELMKRAALDARDATETAVIREAMSADEAGRAASGAWKRLNVKGMNLLTQTDAGLNAVSSAILYDAVYRKEMKRNPGLSREEADRRAMMEVELSLSRKAQPMTPQQRSLAAQTRSVWNVGMLFLGGESINTFAETVALWKQGGMKNKAKSVSMFYAHGLLLASMSAMLNFFTDDERRRKRREWWHIFIDALQGPLQGIPFWGALAGGAVRGMSSLCGYRYYEATTSLVPFASWDNLERAGKDLAKLFDGKDKDWVDFPLAFMGALRMAAFGAALGGASTPKGARFKAAAFSAAAFVNLTEFLLRAMKGLPLRLEGK